MTKLLIKLFIKDADNTASSNVREAYGILAGVVGILSNILLCIIKFVIGSLSGSISVQADAVNNLSDVGSSVVTLIGSKFANKPADGKHPYGHARGEYIASLVIAFIILIIGFELGKSSVEKIIAPEPVEFSIVMIVAMALSILVKLWMSRFTADIGRRIASTTMSAATADSINDVISTGAILACAILCYFTGINIDGYVGVVVACFILYSGIGILRDTISPLLGEAPDPDVVDRLSEKLMAYDGIIVLHDIMIHSYGPGRLIASAHAEVRSDSDILAIHEVIDRAEAEVGGSMGILLTIHLDPVEVDNEILNHAKAIVAEIIASVGDNIRFHDFRMVSGENQTNLIFDIVVPPETKSADAAELKARIKLLAREKNPQYNCVINVDFDYARGGK